MQTAFYRALEQANRAIGSAADPTAAAHAVADQFATAAKARETWACQQGCAHCCRFPVGVTVTEALRLGEALRLAPVAERQRLLHLYDRLGGARGDRVESIWRIAARGAFY